LSAWGVGRAGKKIATPLTPSLRYGDLNFGHRFGSANLAVEASSPNFYDELC
jgi:hypothetical protein